MKRRNKNEFNVLLSEYRTSYYFSFLSMFFLLSLVLGIFAYYSTKSSYLQSTEKIIIDFSEEINGREYLAGEEIDLKPNDPRMVIAYAYIDKTNKLCYKLYGLNESENPVSYSEFWKAANNKSNNNEFYIDDVGGFKHLIYTFELSDMAKSNIIVEGYNAKFAKVFINIQGEIDSRTSFMRAYVTCAVIMVAISGVAAVYMSKKTLSPLKDFVQKQVDFVSDASHELRTPLAVVQSKIENILASPDMKVMDVSEELAVSLSEINRLNKLANELLTLARNDKNTIDVNLELCNINELVKKISEPFKEIMEIHNREFEYSASECYARVDKDKLKQILIILLDNAIKYSNEGDKITIFVYSLSNEVCIEVVDTGVGMSDEAIKHVFERFYREDKARSRETGGTGLGLSIASTLVNLHKGSIRAEHNNPKGSRFIITLPRVRNIK